MPSAARCARTAAKWPAHASHRWSTSRGAAAMSAARSGSFESRSRSGLTFRRAASAGARAAACAWKYARSSSRYAGPALAVADRVEVDGHVGHATHGIEAQAQLDQLRIDRRPGVADGLDVPLPELAVAAGLRPVVAEHRPAQAEPHRLRQGLHAVLDVGAHDARPSPPAAAPSDSPSSPSRRRHAEELLLHDVGGRADAALEDLALLEERRVHLGDSRTGRPARGRCPPGARRPPVRRAAGRGCRGAHGTGASRQVYRRGGAARGRSARRGAAPRDVPPSGALAAPSGALAAPPAAGAHPSPERWPSANMPRLLRRTARCRWRDEDDTALHGPSRSAIFVVSHLFGG